MTNKASMSLANLIPIFSGEANEPGDIQFFLTQLNDIADLENGQTKRN